MQRGTQKSFQEILNEHIGEKAEAFEPKDFSTNNLSKEHSIFNSWDTIQNFALKNIKTHFANTTYRIHIVNQEVKRAEALQLKFHSVYAKLDTQELQQAFKFFFDRGATSFFDLSSDSLKKDFRMLAKKLHPDLSRESSSSLEKAQEFHILKKSYDIITDYIHSQKIAAEYQPPSDILRANS